MKKQRILKRVLGAACALAMVLSCAAPARAMEDMTEPNPTITEHPGAMTPALPVTPVGSRAFYKIDQAQGKVLCADRDDGSGGWRAVPSAYIQGSSYNVGNVAYGAYFVGDEVIFVPLTDCYKDGDNYTYHHGTTSSAAVSDEVDTATNAKPDMSTHFYLNVQNGIDPDGTISEEVVSTATGDPRVEYEVTIATRATYQLSATVPMYVCMYGYRGTGNVLTPDSTAYQLKNYSTANSSAKATVADITRLTHYARIYDENHSDETLYSIAYDSAAKQYTYWYSDPSTEPGWTEPDNYLVLTDRDVNASGQCYVICLDGAWDFKVAGILVGDTLRETVAAIDPAHPLANDLVYGEFNFGKQFAVGAAAEGGKDKGLALRVTDIQAEPATWTLVNMHTSAEELRRGQLTMSLAPKAALADASALDLSTVSAITDITERGWVLAAPTDLQDGKAATPTTLPVWIWAQMAGGNVNASGHTSAVKVTYTLAPAGRMGDVESNTVEGDSTPSNRA